MFRLIRFLLLLALIVVIVVGVYLWMGRVSMMERFFTRALGTPVTIDTVHIGWNKLTVQGLKIANPPNSKIPFAFQGGTITLEMSPFELWEETVHIDRLAIVNPTIGIELYDSSGLDNNWSRLINNFPTSSTPGKQRNFVIQTFTIDNLQFQVLRSNGKEVPIAPIPHVEFTNLGTDRPLPLAEIGRIVFQTILATLTSKQYLGALLDNVVDLPSSLLEGIQSTLPLEEAKGAIQEGLETFRRKTKEATEFLQDLFKKP